MKRLLSCLTALMLIFAASPAQGEGTALLIWTTSESLGASYQALAEKWNQQNTDQPIDVTVKVYSRERIASKLTHAFTGGVRFGSNTLPALADIDLLSFPDYIFEQTTDLYPLQNLLVSGRLDSAPSIGEWAFTHNGICFALPYAYGDLALCYRLSLLEALPDLKEQAVSFEGLESLAQRYRSLTGQPLLEVDYLGGECFSALYGQAEGSEENAYAQTVEWLQKMQNAGFSTSLSTGSAYGEAFQNAMKEGGPACFITTVSNLLTLADDQPEVAALYGVLPLPSFGGVSTAIRLPATATAVINAGGATIRAKQFLAFCRFSDEAKEYPLLYLGQPTTDGDELLAAHYQTDGQICASGEVRTFQADGGLAQRILSHPTDVLQ